MSDIGVRGQDVRSDFERRIHSRLTDTAQADPDTKLPAPQAIDAQPGRGFVRLRWGAVAGAAGYLIERTDGRGAGARIVTHGGSDVPAIPGIEFADTGLSDGVDYSYRIGAVSGASDPAWEWSTPVTARTSTESAGPVTVHVDAGRTVGRLDRVWRMVGSERLTQLRFGRGPGGHDIGAEFADALRLAATDLGVTHVRAHAILHDDNQVVTRTGDRTLRFDFSRVDALYDQILGLGLRPVVELSFMPAALAADPTKTVFAYRGIVSPPRSWAEWRALVAALAGHLVERYGVAEVAQWGFEVWNEPNLEVFWSGTQQDYLRLYTEAAEAVKEVDGRLRVGGPASAAAEWIETLAGHVEQDHLPLDFVTTHTYGNLPLDVRSALRRHGLDDAAIYWTEWGVGSTHFGPIHDAVIGAPFMLSGYAAVRGRMQALAYWVISDHFEELGRPSALLHNGFGLLTVGNLRKPRYWAAHLAAHQGDAVLATDVRGDGADVLVEAGATWHADGTVDVLVWNGTINAELMHGDSRLDRHVTVEIDGLPDGTYRAELARIDQTHSNIAQWAPAGVDWPDDAQFAELRRHDELHTEALPDVAGGAGPARAADLDLPMPGVARIRLIPAAAFATNKEIAR